MNQLGPESKKKAGYLASYVNQETQQGLNHGYAKVHKEVRSHAKNNKQKSKNLYQNVTNSKKNHILENALLQSWQIKEEQQKYNNVILTFRYDKCSIDHHLLRHIKLSQ